jgi:hypothetical protein
MAVAIAPFEERDGFRRNLGGRPCRCSLYYSQRRRLDLVKLATSLRDLTNRTAGANVLVFKGRAPEKGAATEARPLRRYARAADCERGECGDVRVLRTIAAQETAAATLAKGAKTTVPSPALRAP